MTFSLRYYIDTCGYRMFPFNSRDRRRCSEDFTCGIIKLIGLMSSTNIVRDGFQLCQTHTSLASSVAKLKWPKLF